MAAPKNTPLLPSFRESEKAPGFGKLLTGPTPTVRVGGGTICRRGATSCARRRHDSPISRPYRCVFHRCTIGVDGAVLEHEGSGAPCAHKLSFGRPLFNNRPLLKWKVAYVFKKKLLGGKDVWLNNRFAPLPPLPNPLPLLWARATRMSAPQCERRCVLSVNVCVCVCVREYCILKVLRHLWHACNQGQNSQWIYLPREIDCWY